MRSSKNTSEELTQEQKNQVLDNYTKKLLASGHNRAQAHRIMTAGLTGYERLLKKQVDGIANIHRPSSSGLAARNRKKLLNKTKWFKVKQQEGKNTGKETLHIENNTTLISLKPSSDRKGPKRAQRQSYQRQRNEGHLNQGFL